MIFTRKNAPLLIMKDLSFFVSTFRNNFEKKPVNYISDGYCNGKLQEFFQQSLKARF